MRYSLLSIRRVKESIRTRGSVRTKLRWSLSKRLPTGKWNWVCEMRWASSRKGGCFIKQGKFPHTLTHTAGPPIFAGTILSWNTSVETTPSRCITRIICSCASANGNTTTSLCSYYAWARRSEPPPISIDHSLSSEWTHSFGWLWRSRWTPESIQEDHNEATKRRSAFNPQRFWGWRNTWGTMGGALRVSKQWYCCLPALRLNNNTWILSRNRDGNF